MRFSKSLPLLLLIIMLAHACTPSVHIYKRSQVLMGTVVEITVVARNEEKAEEAIRPLTDLRNILVDETAETLFLKEKGMRINLGGIGKGFAADYAYNVLLKQGVKSGIVAIAGDLRVFGKRPDGSTWNIGIRHPRKKEGVMAQVRFLDRADMAISTSGDYERFFMKNGGRYHHVLSPDTLHPSRGNQSASVTAR